MRRVALSGLLALAASAPAAAQVEVPEGFEVVDAVVWNQLIQWPSLSDCGQIAYAQKFTGSWWTAEIMLYDNGRIVQITDNDVVDSGVDLNSTGDIVWMRSVRSVDPHQVILYQDGVETLLQDGERILTHVSMNNHGDVVWSRFRSETCPLLSDVYLYNGRRIRQIHSSKLLLQHAEINDEGWITWMSTDFCVDPWIGTIQLYRNGDIVDLPSFHSQVQGPKINNLGQIVWQAQSNLELWEDGNTKIIVDTVDARVPNIGDTGDVYFSRGAPENDGHNAWLYRVEHPLPRFYRLSDDRYSTSRGTVNAWGEVAWVHYRDPNHGDFSGGIRFMRRIRTGDSDFDGAVDLEDYARLHDCFTGPIRTDGLCECRFLDQDHDGDLDLADYARLQTAFTPQ